MTAANKAGLILFLIGLTAFFSGNPEADTVSMLVQLIGSVLFMQEYI